MVEATLAGTYDPFVVNAAVNEAIWRKTTLGRVDQGFRSISDFQRQGGVSGWAGREIGERLRESRIGGAIRAIEEVSTYSITGSVRRAIRDRAIRSYRENK